MGRFVALLRAINVGAARKLAMAELRDACTLLGWRDVVTYIQSGNVLFSSDGEPAALERELEQAIERRFGMSVPVIVQPGSEWHRYCLRPFADVAAVEPNRLMLMLSKRPPMPDAAERLKERARDGERIAAAGDAVWIHYAAGAGSSRLSPSLIDRLIGSPATARNYRTVMKLQEMLDR